MPKRKAQPVGPSNEEVAESYDRISRFYALIEGILERGARESGLELLGPREGEVILEVGPGPGVALEEIARAVGERGEVHGVDAAEGMVESARGRLEGSGLSGRTEVIVGDARDLPYGDDEFDAVYISQTLELFDGPEIPRVLEEARRVLRGDGRMVVVSMCREGHEDSLFVRAYEWLHRGPLGRLGCRPIYVEGEIEGAGFGIEETREMKLMGFFPKRAVRARVRRG